MPTSVHIISDRFSCRHEKLSDIMWKWSKLDSTFPSNQFLINSFYVPYRLDRNKERAGISLYVRDKISVLPMSRYSLPPHIEILLLELNLRNRKWLIYCSYNSQNNLVKEHLRVLTEGIQFYSKDCENIILIGDYNAKITETNISSFCGIYHLTDIIKQPAGFKNSSNPSCIDLFLTNNAKCFQKSSVFVTGLSDFNELYFYRNEIVHS